jgi:hypothetical protein
VLKGRGHLCESVLCDRLRSFKRPKGTGIWRSALLVAVARAKLHWLLCGRHGNLQ